MVRFRTLLIGVFVAAMPQLVQAADPVTTFIVSADSIANTADDDALAGYIDDNQILVGAVVGQLLHVAITVGDEGHTSDEAENIAFAGKIATIHEANSGSRIPMELVNAYRGWTPDQRATRRKAVALEQQAGEARSARDFDTAVKLLGQANTLYTEIHDSRSVAVNWGTQGVVQWGAGNMDAVFEAYGKALEARRGIEDRILEGRTLNGLGSAHYMSGDLAKAGEYYDAAIDLRRRTGDLAALGTSLTYRGNVYRDSGRPIEAREAYEQAFKIFETNGEPWQRSQTLDSIATLYYQMNRLQAANDAYLEAIAIAVQYREPRDEIIYRNNLSANLLEENRFSEALSQLSIVDTLLRDNPDQEQKLRFHQNRGMVYSSMDEFARARDDLLKMRDLATQYEAPRFQLQSLMALGWLYLRMGAPERGVQLATRAKEIAYEIQDGRLAREADMQAAVLQRNLGHYGKALEHWNQALEQDDYDGLPGFVLQDRMGIANVHVASGDTEEALGRFRELRPEVDAGGDTELILALDFGTGHAFERTNADSAAWYYERAMERMERDREAIAGAEVQSAYLSGVRRYNYEEIARYYGLLYLAGRGEQWGERAFHTIERAKARGLLDMLQTSIGTQESADEREVLDQMYGLDEAAPNYTEERRALEDRYARLHDARLAASVGGLDAGVVAIDDVSGVLDRKTTVLAYALGDSASILWAIDRKGFDMFELPARPDLNDDVRRLRDALARPGAGDKALRAAARQLYATLVEPARERVGDSRNLVIVPDGFLFEIPFEILLSEETKEGEAWSNMPYLVRSHTTVYSPSVSVFVQLQRKKSRKYALDLVAVGDPRFDTLEGDGAKLADLPYTREEVMSISAPVKDKKKRVLLGDDASESHLKATLAESTPRLLHLATHGLVDPADPVASSVALCRSAGSEEDGYLHMLEILSMRLDVGLVVLSACESARGQVSRGEGVVGLGRAFIASGAHGIVASLWAVSDESTSALMTEFYKNMLGRKKSAGEAMRTARLALLDNPEYAHPFYWSPFIVIGAERSPW